MVPPKKNRTEIVGRIVDWETSLKNPSIICVQIDVISSADVPGFPNLVKEIEGKRIVACIHRRMVDKKVLSLNATIRCQIKRKSPTMLSIHPENITIEQ